MAPCTSCLLSRSSNCHSQHFCDVCKYMFTMDPGNGHNNWFSNCVFKVYAYCHHCSTVHEVQNILGSTMLCLSNSSLSNTSKHDFAHHHSTAVNNESAFDNGDNDVHDNDDTSTSKVVDNDSNCLRDSSDSNESSSFLNGTSTHVDSKVFFNGLNGCKFYYNSSQDKIGFIPHNIDDIPVPPQFKIPSSCQLSMSTHELELTLFINENFLSPSIFDKVMKWARSATAEGYKFNFPSYSTLKKQNKWIKHSPILLMVVLSNLRSSYQMRLDQTSQSQCGTLRIPLELFAKSLWDPQVMKDFVCFHQRKYTDCGSHVCMTRLHQLTGSMKHSTIHLPLKVEYSGLGVYLLV